MGLWRGQLKFSLGVNSSCERWFTAFFNIYLTFRLILTKER